MVQVDDDPPGGPCRRVLLVDGRLLERNQFHPGDTKLRARSGCAAGTSATTRWVWCRDAGLLEKTAGSAVLA
jgi:hypothetical protein